MPAIPGGRGVREAMSPEVIDDMAQVCREAAEAASAVLKEYWVGGVFPVDPVAIARDLGVEVYSADLGSEVLAVMLIEKQTAQILVHEDLPAVRYRYWAAHALGHYVRHREAVDDIGFVDSRSPTNEADPEEIFADYFAAALLMPGEELNPSAWTTSRTSRESPDVAAAARFGVPLDALNYIRRPVAA